MLLTNIKNRSGFTLIEVIVAIFILTIGVMGAYAVVQQIIASTSITSSRLVAAYLAQEGIEIVRNIRDTNFILGNDWDNGLGTGEKEVDYTMENELESWTDRYLKIKSNGFYNYDSGSPTRFKRKITITKVEAYKREILVEVFWEGGKVSAKEYLYNWRYW